jgi:type IV secretory pathway VirJ component
MLRTRIFIALITALVLGRCSSSCVVEMRAMRSSDTFAIIVTGDGGWRALDRDIARDLNAAGVSVVGLVSPEFFSERRTANEASHELSALIDRYSIEWDRPNVVLVGYSRGAGVLPFMISRLSPADRARIRTVALIGLERDIDFKTSPKSLIWPDADDLTIPVRPELRKIRPIPVLCFSGTTDRDAICRDLPPDLATAVLIPGGHHVGGNYAQISGHILHNAGVEHPNPALIVQNLRH